MIIDPTFPSDGPALTQNKAGNSFRPPILVRSAPEAVRYLTDSQLQFGAVYLNPILTAPGAIALIRLIHEYQPATPIFILYDESEGSSCPFSQQEMNRLAIQGALARNTGESVLSSLRPSFTESDQETELSPLEEQQFGTHPPTYIPVPILRFAFGAKCFFDVHVRVSETKFVKVLPAGNVFAKDRLQNYLRKGVSHLYLQRTHHKRCLDYCTLLERTFLASPGLSSVIKITQTMNRGQNFFDRLKDSRKLSEEQIEGAVEFISDVRRLVSQLNLDRRQEVRALLNNIAMYDHALGTTILSTIFASQLEFGGDLSAEMLGLASLFHDIGLGAMPPAVQAEDLSKMSSKEKELFLDHPVQGAQILRDTGCVHPVVLQAIAQHHERRNGSGFPHHLSGAQIHRISEVVAFSEEFARLLQTQKNQALEGIIQQMTETSFEQYSISLVEAFERIFG